ncbi:glycosyltransferase family 2 protein [Dethiosulfovibrio salsuginis]|uniref:Glycosyltransferase involved in cell wall bisynthesis n=1 Tax=Dethiosulfovibrio salsuginis TaxID=561720 RepID=A0A1X7K4S4_9BACT|nr:glycosyltransferase family 2 protein [Dethiosulfovibrio salsuginis]SMG35929.1 Glycosyltransferase involved in cell wall bisynthesis [Dethiosulfovibrio salsuginis]
MARLSVYMITLNEELRLPIALKALSGIADEIIVVDSGSSDGTVEIAKSFGAKVFFREWDNYSSQKKYAENICSGDWLMNLDADEEVSPALAKEILSAIQLGKHDAYRLRISDIYPGQNKPNPWVRHYKVIRLYRKGVAKMGDTLTWDRVALLDKNAKVGLLKGFILHRSVTSIRQALDKYNSYSEEQAVAASLSGKKYSPWRMVFAINLNFIRYFFIHRRFLHGFWGYIDSVNLSYARFLKFAKSYERDKHAD